jgi:hypothetical protein
MPSLRFRGSLVMSATSYVWTISTETLGLFRFVLRSGQVPNTVPNALRVCRRHCTGIAPFMVHRANWYPQRRVRRTGLLFKRRRRTLAPTARLTNPTSRIATEWSQVLHIGRLPVVALVALVRAFSGAKSISDAIFVSAAICTPLTATLRPTTVGGAPVSTAAAGAAAAAEASSAPTSSAASTPTACRHPRRAASRTWARVPA